MFKKIRKIALMGGVLAAVSFGCTALAAAGAAPVPPTQAPVKAAKATAPPSADKETADGGEFGNNEADEETAEGGSAAPETGSEVPGSDGPGGHADEPGNPNAQHEAGGQTEG